MMYSQSCLEVLDQSFNKSHEVLAFADAARDSLVEHVLW